MVYTDINEKERFADYREYLYEKGGLDTGKGVSINEKIVAKERKKNYEFTTMDRFTIQDKVFYGKRNNRDKVVCEQLLRYV